MERIVCYTLFYYLNQWRFTPEKAEKGQENSRDIEGNRMIVVSLEHSAEYIKLLEGADGQLMLCMEQVS